MKNQKIHLLCDGEKEYSIYKETVKPNKYNNRTTIYSYWDKDASIYEHCKDDKLLKVVETGNGYKIKLGDNKTVDVDYQQASLLMIFFRGLFKEEYGGHTCLEESKF